MPYINSIDTEGIQAGTAPTPPLATVDLWPSLDPTRPYTLQSSGINNFNALTYQIGANYNIGLTNSFGLDATFGASEAFGIDGCFGGALDAQPYFDSSAPSIDFNSPNGDLNGFWKFNGSVICTAPCSDSNAKKNILPIQNSLDKVLKLQGVSFDWNEKTVPKLAETGGRQIGLIAQEVEKIVPEVVSTTVVENKSLKSVRYENLISVLIEAVKEQQSQIEDLRGTVQELSTKLAECCK